MATLFRQYYPIRIIISNRYTCFNRFFGGNFGLEKTFFNEGDCLCVAVTISPFPLKLIVVINESGHIRTLPWMKSK